MCAIQDEPTLLPVFTAASHPSHLLGQCQQLAVSAGTTTGEQGKVKLRASKQGWASRLLQWQQQVCMQPLRASQLAAAHRGHAFLSPMLPKPYFPTGPGRAEWRFLLKAFLGGPSGHSAVGGELPWLTS